GAVRPVPGPEARLAAARAAGCRTVFAPGGTEGVAGIRLVRVRHVREVMAALDRPRAGGARAGREGDHRPGSGP
ncbi:MAG TPA: hypothetical protein VNO79_15640, partial [Actinomycetota bacterium]|nr:hypothetical protein [Actinomycetota bacterium]